METSTYTTTSIIDDALFLMQSHVTLLMVTI